MTVILTSIDTCGALFAAHPDAVNTTGTKEWMTVEVPGAGKPAYFMIIRDAAAPGRYSLRLWPEGYIGDVEPGTEPPGEITDVLTCGIPVARGR